MFLRLYPPIAYYKLEEKETLFGMSCHPKVKNNALKMSFYLTTESWN